MAKIRRENVYPMWGLFYRLKMSSLKTGSELNFYPSVMSPQHLIQNKFGIKELIRWISSVQSFSCVQLFVTPWAAACQASPSITNSRSLLKLTSITSVMPSNYRCHPHLLLPSIFPSIRVFSNESALHIRWPKYWSFSISISPSNEPPRTDLL